MVAATRQRARLEAAAVFDQQVKGLSRCALPSDRPRARRHGGHSHGPTFALATHGFTRQTWIHSSNNAAAGSRAIALLHPPKPAVTHLVGSAPGLNESIGGHAVSGWWRGRSHRLLPESVQFMSRAASA